MAIFGVTYPGTPSPTVFSHSSTRTSASSSWPAATRMSAATFSTSSNRSCSYRLLVNPSPVRAIPDSASLHRRSSCAETTRGSLASASATSRRLNASQCGQHGPLDVLTPADVDLCAMVVDDVEGVDDLGTVGSDLGVTHVEVESGEGAGDPVEGGDAIRSAHLDQGGAR